jgi:Kef-type K+ transport system membrane component KefB
MHHSDLLTAIGISIVAAATLALGARWIRQPLILGYVLGGALLGPNLGFGVVRDEASIELISEIGLILLLFIIGLEISVPGLAQTGRTIIVTGALQFPICAALAWLAAGKLPDMSAGPFDRLYVAVALGLSSTLIVVKLLFDKSEMGTLAGRITVGVLIFQDLWAIAFLALQPNLTTLQLAPLIQSLARGVGLVATAVVLSRLVLPRLFRAIARSPELMLVTSMAWCFLVSGAAGGLGLSKEMGALIAGMVIAAFPYGTEVVSRLSGVRDFFVTLFFVALGLKIPAPSGQLLGLALIVAIFVATSRVLSIFPIFALLRLDTRTAGVVTINLAQVSEFSLVIVTLGAGYGHVSPGVVALVLYTLLVTSVLSTYAIFFNHQLATAIARALAAVGVPHWPGAGRQVEPAVAGGPPTTQHDLFLLGVSREGLAFLEHLERQLPAMKERIVAIDFNPVTLERLRSYGVECHYGDISNVETLRHAGIERAAVAVSSISDWFLKGIDNRRILRQVRSLAPKSRIVVTADTLTAAEQLYAEGADYVVLPSALAAEHLYGLLLDGSPDTLARARARQAADLFGRHSPPSGS